jgi:hypothetical protein
MAETRGKKKALEACISLVTLIGGLFGVWRIYVTYSSLFLP